MNRDRKKLFREWLSISVAKRPGRIVLLIILLFNLLFFILSAVVISYLAPPTLQARGFWPSIVYTITMILDAGCIQFVIEDVGQAGVAIIIACLLIVVIGMITFTGAVIGYVTNYISRFIDDASDGNHPLKISGHIVILDWNNRASEIINDLLYSGERETVVVLVSGNKEIVESEISERLLDTMAKERQALELRCSHMTGWKKRRYIHQHRLRNRVTVIVRQGETYSTKQLNDAGVSSAKSVVILAHTARPSICAIENRQQRAKYERGDSHTIKALIQVADMTGNANSRDDQMVIVEVEDDWTHFLVNRIIVQKERQGKCRIIPVPVHQLLGQLLAQFCIMPELNLVYSELFSNRGATFFAEKEPFPANEEEYNRKYMETHLHSIPLVHMQTQNGPHRIYIAGNRQEGALSSPWFSDSYQVKLNPNFWFARKNVVILGHNSKCRDIMEGFNAFRAEWNFPNGDEILNIIVIDSKSSLERLNYYQDYPYINRVVEADIYDRDLIYRTVRTFSETNAEDTSVLILSDDAVMPEDFDATALTYLIYVQDIITDRAHDDPTFDRESIDVIVEILDPKNYDTVHNYSVENVVISNRYISKMVTQVGEEKSLFEFYHDILTYDEISCASYQSNEIYAKPVMTFFQELPGPCTAAQLIRAVYEASPAGNKSIVLGYVSPHGKSILFRGDQNHIPVRLTRKDKLIVFSNH